MDTRMVGLVWPSMLCAPTSTPTSPGSEITPACSSLSIYIAQPLFLPALKSIASVGGASPGEKGWH